MSEQLNEYQREQRRIGDFYAGYVPPEKDSHHAVALQWTTVVEGEDEEGYYTAELASVDTAAVMHALLEALPRDDTPNSDVPSLTLEVYGVTVKVEWNAAWRIPPRPDL